MAARCLRSGRAGVCDLACCVSAGRLGGLGPLADDNFNRTVAAGWGNADTGGFWTVVGRPWSWSVSPGTANVTVAANEEERSYLGSVNAQDVDLLARVVLPRGSQSNSTLAYLLGRYTATYSPSYYRVGVGQGSGSSVIIRAQLSDHTNIASDVNTAVIVSLIAVDSWWRPCESSVLLRC